VAQWLRSRFAVQGRVMLIVDYGRGLKRKFSNEQVNKLLAPIRLLTKVHPKDVMWLVRRITRRWAKST
jgi:hypothetical protein